MHWAVMRAIPRGRNHRSNLIMSALAGNCEQVATKLRPRWPFKRGREVRAFHLFPARGFGLLRVTLSFSLPIVASPFGSFRLETCFLPAVNLNAAIFSLGGILSDKARDDTHRVNLGRQNTGWLTWEKGHLRSYYRNSLLWL